MHGGKQVGEKRAYSDRLLMSLLRHHDPEKYGANPGLRPGTKSESRRQQEETGQSIEQEFAEREDIGERIAQKLRNARNIYVRSIAHDRKKRAAWDRLCPRVNWRYAAEGAPRILPDGTQQSLFIPKVDKSFPHMLSGEFVIPIANGFMPELSVLSDLPDDPAVDPVHQMIEALKRQVPAGELPEFDMAEAVAGLRETMGLGPWVPGETVAQVMRRARANQSDDPDAEARADPASLRSFSPRDFIDRDRADSDSRVEALRPFADGNLDKAGIAFVPLPEVGRDTDAEGEAVPNDDEALREEKLRLAREWVKRRT